MLSISEQKNEHMLAISKTYYQLREPTHYFMLAIS